MYRKIKEAHAPVRFIIFLYKFECYIKAANFEIIKHKQ